MTDTPVSEMTFEQAMAEFESVVQQLDRGDVALDASIKLYKRGAELKAHCEAKLREAEEQVEQLVLNTEGQPTGSRPAGDQ
jgi:exodeoxyribonuclease VII small subunit